MQNVIVYYNPASAASRKVLEMVQGAGIEPQVVEYMKAPLSVPEWRGLLQKMGAQPLDLIRRDLPPYVEDFLAARLSEEQDLVCIMQAHPIIIRNPIVVADSTVLLCDPPEKVLDIIR